MIAASEGEGVSLAGWGLPWKVRRGVRKPHPAAFLAFRCSWVGISWVVPDRRDDCVGSACVRRSESCCLAVTAARGSPGRFPGGETLCAASFLPRAWVAHADAARPEGPRTAESPAARGAAADSSVHRRWAPTRCRRTGPHSLV